MPPRSTHVPKRAFRAALALPPGRRWQPAALEAVQRAAEQHVLTLLRTAAARSARAGTLQAEDFAAAAGRAP